MTHGTIALAATLALWAFTAGARELGFDPAHDLASGHPQAVHISVPAESIDDAQARANVLGLDKKTAETAVPFTCLQLLVIDELELEETADCD